MGQVRNLSSESLGKGDLCGHRTLRRVVFYTGTWYREEDYAELPSAQRQRLDEYAMAVKPKSSQSSVDAEMRVARP
eukprot:3643359-Prymnesium_polylepis.1